MSLVSLGFRNSFRRPVRTSLSVLGIALCVMLMLTVAAVSQRYEAVVNQSYSLYNSNVVVVSRASLLIEGLPLGGVLPETEVPVIQAVQGVSTVTPILIVVDVKQLVPTNITIGIPIQNFTMFEKTTQIQLQGSYPASDNQIVVGSYLAGTSHYSVGSTVKEGGNVLTISGIMSTSNLLLGSAVIMPLATAQSTQGYGGFVSAILVNSKSSQPADVIQRINSQVSGVLAINPSQSFFLSNPLLASIGAINYGVGGFSLLLALLFVTIISSVNLLEQKNEFWTLRAMGSSSWSILKVALSETGMISFVGFGLGLVLSALATAVSIQNLAALSFTSSLSGAFTLIPPLSILYAGMAVVGAGAAVGAATSLVMLRELK